MELFTYLMAKNDHNTSVKKDLFSYLLGKNQSGTYQEFTGTSISANNTKKAKMKLDLYGNTSQTGTPTPDSPIPVNVVSGDNTIVSTGKNLFDISKVVKGRLDSGVIGYESNTTDLTLNTSSFSFTTNAGYRGATSDYIQVKNGTYSFNSNALNSSYGCEIASYDEDKVWLENASQTALASQTKRTFTISNNAKYIRIYFYLSSAGTITIESPQLELGSTPTTYEAYTGTNYQINLPIENLFDKDTATIISAYFDNNTTTITSSGTNKTTYWEVQPNTTYTVSKFKSSRGFIGTTTTTPTTGVSVSNIVNIGYGTYDGIVRDSGTITTGASDIYIVINYANTNSDTGDTPTNIFESIQIEKGTKKNSYTPYGTAQIELCKISTYQDRFIRTTGKNLMQAEYYNTTNYVSQELSLKAGEYYVSYTGDNSSAIYLRKADGTTPINGTSVKERYNGTTLGFTLTEAGNYYIQFYKSGGYTTFTNAMLELGTELTHTDYEPYGTNEWYLEKKIGKVDLGTLTCKPVNNNATSRTQGLFYVYFSSILKSTNFSTTPDDTLSNKYVNGYAYNYLSPGRNPGDKTMSRYDFNIYIQNSSFSEYTDEQVQSALNGTILYYPLATPTYTPITGTLKDELEAAWRANSYKGTTNISQVNNDLPFNLDVEIKVGS